MTPTDLSLLEALCSIHAPSGDEVKLTRFILDYVQKHRNTWDQQPEVISGPEFQDCVLLKFGTPRLAAIAHLDSTGFTVRYENQLIPIGSPEASDGDWLVGSDGRGDIECRLKFVDNHAFYDFGRNIDRGTSLTYRPQFRFDGQIIESPYLDNRAGVYNLLKLAETLKDGLLIFSTWEEHGGGSVSFLAKHFYERHQIAQCLISDVTWSSDGIYPGEGVVISGRDSNIPRRSYIEEILSIARSADVRFQIEIESHGSSDAREIQHAPYPIDWCFIGPPSERAHSSGECIIWSDLQAMTHIYRILFEAL
jgi:putative aminopeptidase FrvX